MKQKIMLITFFAWLILSVKEISAHCPLCTVGAGAAAGTAVWLGVSKVVVALFIGGFAMSMAMWVSKAIAKRKRFFIFQEVIILLIVFLLTFVPLLPIVKAVGPVYLSFIGEYGKTYALDYSLVSGLFGAFIVGVSPRLNKRLKKAIKGVPYQGVLLTLALLIISALIIQFFIV